MGIFDSLTLQDFNPLNAIGGVISGIGNIASSKMSKESAEWSTRKQLEWERERAQNAHQWEVKDLENAGLNKILSVNGSGAVTGNITPPMPDYSGIGRAGDAIAHSINSAQDIAIKRKQAEAYIDNINAQTSSILDDMKNGGLKQQQVAKLKSEIRKNDFENKLSETKRETEKTIQELNKKYGKESVTRAQNNIQKTATEAVETAIKHYELDHDLPANSTMKIINTCINAVTAIGLPFAIKGLFSKKMANSIAKKVVKENTRPNFIIKKNGSYINLKTGEIFK